MFVAINNNNANNAEQQTLLANGPSPSPAIPVPVQTHETTTPDDTPSISVRKKDGTIITHTTDYRGRCHSLQLDRMPFLCRQTGKPTADWQNPRISTN